LHCLAKKQTARDGPGLVTLIAAMDETRLIGTGEGGLPWRGMPRDKKHFRDYTAGKALLLGRRTFEEMLGWLDNDHRPIVITRNRAYEPGGDRQVAGDIEEALALAGSRGENEVVVCGGAAIYRMALPFADRLVLTLLHGRFDTTVPGVYFPGWEDANFREVKRERFTADAENPLSMTFLYLAR
jgi:dihydrofolate reductase